VAEPDRLETMLNKHWEIQRKVFGHEFDRMMNEEKILFIKDMVLSATNELHEAMRETGWKSWSTSRHINMDLYMNELVDVYCLLMNLFLVTGMDPEEVARVLFVRVSRKQMLNVQRQESGY
jgi:hypothetical protein